ncbi:MAG: UDP-N-acetylenolpyruvoylglucosamine reductase [Oceanospirillaceae bacterium]|nr:UDP-N-acetylenolpyruvoylglucosamine reductase [Oceanospirillaceae bacterium]
MSLVVRNDVDLQAYNTFGFHSIARQYCELRERADIEALIARQARNGEALLVIGGGSNLLLAPRVPGLVARVALTGIELEELGDHRVGVTVAAGENWHETVCWLLEQGIHGLENLALIPGSVGAAPVQNIGAYGVEAGQFIDAVEVYDWQTGRYEWLSRARCGFAYRDSVFKRLPGRYLILAVRFRLSRHVEPVVTYRPLREALEGKVVDHQAVFEAVCRIRHSKLPDPSRLGNAGSFFKNPVVSADHYKHLQSRYPDIVAFPDPAGYKLAAGWLIDHLGWKGRRIGPVGVHEEQALVLVNHGGADRAAVEALAQAIQSDVKRAFGVMLEIEPVFYPD